MGCFTQFQALLGKIKSLESAESARKSARNVPETATGGLPDAVSGAVRCFPAFFGAVHRACFAEKRLKLPAAACGWRKEL
eukprot:15455133-Alexandrium_andersonii.AAC.1